MAGVRRGLVVHDRSWRGAGAALVVLAAWVGLGSSCSSTRTARAPDGARATMYSLEPEVRVRVRRAAAALRVDGPEKVVIRPTGGGRSRLLATPVEVRNGIGGLTFSDTREKFEPGAGADAEIVAYDAGASATDLPAALLRLDGVDHAGFVTVRARSEEGPDKFDVIVAMPVEDYLPGVVVKEMYTYWPKGAFEMQAVCARTYALHERDRSRRANKPFDVEAGTLDQAYAGATTIRAAQEAVKDTRGMVLTENGALIRAYFSSTCGGRPASAAEVWPTGKGFEYNLAAPLQARARDFACQPSAQFRWEVTRTTDELTQRLRAWGKTAGNPVKTMTALRSIETERVSVTGRPSRYRVTDSRGATFSITGEELRIACNQKADGLPPITRETRVNSGDALVEVRGNTVKISGRGFGHGVGMCQWCAKGFAERGKTWQEMAGLFYPGAEVMRAY